MDYQLKPLGKTCAATSRPLVPGSVCHCVVVEREGQLVRLDYPADGWTGAPPEAIGYWKRLVPAPKVAAAVDPDVLLRYFEQLCQDGDPEQEAQRYAAALMLLKFKRLKLEDVRSVDGAEDEFLVLHGVRGEGPFLIRNLRLSDAAAQELQTAMRLHLATEWS